MKGSDHILAKKVYSFLTLLDGPQRRLEQDEAKITIFLLFLEKSIESLYYKHTPMNCSEWRFDPERQGRPLDTNTRSQNGYRK